MRRLYAAVLAAALTTVVACSPDAEPATPAPGPSAGESSSSPVEPTASVRTAWQASDVHVRPDWVGARAPWVWEYSDDVVVIGPRGLIALDRATGAEVWRLPLGGRVCGATPSPSQVGLVAVLVGRCQAATRTARGGARIATGGPATARRTVLKAVDLESASVVWERSVAGAPLLDIGGEVLLAVDGCGTRRINLSSGAPLGGLGVGCSDLVLAGDGVVLVSAVDAPHEWRAVDVESGSTIAEATGSETTLDPRRILTAEPLTVLAASDPDAHLDLVRVEDDGVRVLNAVPSEALGAFSSATGDSVVFADQSWPGATELSLDDGSVLRELPGVGAAQWIPFALHEGGVLGFEGNPRGLVSGHGRLTLRSLDGEPVTVLGELGGRDFRGETNLAAAAPKAVVIDDILLMPGHGNVRVLAYRLIDPTAG